MVGEQTKKKKKHTENKSSHPLPHQLFDKLGVSYRSSSGQFRCHENGARGWERGEKTKTKKYRWQHSRTKESKLFRLDIPSPPFHSNAAFPSLYTYNGTNTLLHNITWHADYVPAAVSRANVYRRAGYEDAVRVKKKQISGAQPTFIYDYCVCV